MAVASFAYGVLKELSRTQMSTDKSSRPLLHEVDVISSVSGGSFTSAYYTLHGDRIFEASPIHEGGSYPQLPA